MSPEQTEAAVRDPADHLAPARRLERGKLCPTPNPRYEGLFLARPEDRRRGPPRGDVEPPPGSSAASSRSLKAPDIQPPLRDLDAEDTADGAVTGSPEAAAAPKPARSDPARPTSLLDADAMDAELARLKASNRVRRRQLKQLRKAGSLLGDVLARGFLTAYLLHLCEEHPRHGNDILKEIEARTEGLWSPSSGGVYTLLRKLEKRQLLEGVWETGTTRERHVYHITPDGRATLDEFRELAPPRIAAASRVLQLVGTDLLSPSEHRREQ